MLLDLVFCLHESLTRNESFILTLDLLRWQWKPHAIPEALLVTRLSQVHPNAQKLCRNQGLDSGVSVLYRWDCCVSAPPIPSSKHTAWYMVRSATTLSSRATTALPASNNSDTVTKPLLIYPTIFPTKKDLKQALLKQQQSVCDTFPQIFTGLLGVRSTCSQKMQCVNDSLPMNFLGKKQAKTTIS